MIALLLRYRAERLPWTMAVLVPVLLAIAAQGGGGRGLRRFGVDVLLAFLLFAHFRVLDDLADRDRDARIHPERALVSATRVWPVSVAGLILGSGTVALLLFRRTAPVVFLSPMTAYLILVVFLGTWYALRRERTLLGDHLLLAKYPLFVWIIAAARVGPAAWTAEIWLSMLAAYLTACVYEALHDARSPARVRPTLVAGEGALLGLTLAALAMRGSV